MIQANELRIGNWVLDADGEYWQIEELSPVLKNNEYRWNWLKQVHPIPLTPEILVGCGMPKDTRDGQAIYWGGSWDYLITEKDFMFYLHSEYDGSIFHVKRLKHLQPCFILLLTQRYLLDRRIKGAWTQIQAFFIFASMIVQLFKSGDRVRDKYTGIEGFVLRYHDEREIDELAIPITHIPVPQKEAGLSPILIMAYVKDGKLQTITTHQLCLELIK